MMSKHTPGPWKEIRGAVHIIRDSDGPSDTIEYVDLTLDKEKQSARLIAAAPEAHALLKKFEWRGQRWVGNSSMHKYCLACGHADPNHFDDCPLAAYFRKVEGIE